MDVLVDCLVLIMSVFTDYRWKNFVPERKRLNSDNGSHNNAVYSKSRLTESNYHLLGRRNQVQAVR
jgi:hypothetical protein